ncbi:MULTISPECIES: diguanylate cyclase [unclassified Pseudomonas]|uniref:diguanylate cyclase domain-containing protein n=1 Tax=unclassified Pseudomonas TaxID=196821 RepID=UPI0024473A2B|nr:MULTISPECIES: diguanylate cyclase [unclassified Pseudomonas]MDH0303469.1 sensor domain-containing diguanylate cyclase [Pseudomonas sp. GD04091]MDH1984464.1 sensor domain-containing diguanylate cyclase [Pseudomonas sp. GD03689]
MSISEPLSPRVRSKWMLPVIFFTLSLVPTLAIVLAFEDSYGKIRSGRSHQAADHFAHAVERSLTHALNAAYGLGAAVRHHDGRLDDFAELSTYIVPHPDRLYALALAPDGNITQTAPINRQILADSSDFSTLFGQHNRKMEMADLPADRVTFKGPLRLGDGSLGAVGVIPIFIGKHAADKKFWGLSVVAIHLDSALLEAELESIGKLGYRYKLSGLNPITGNLETLLGGTIAEDDPQPVIQRPIEGTALWLSVICVDRPGYAGLIMAIAMALLICCLIAWSCYTRLQLIDQKKELKNFASFDTLTGLPNRRLLMTQLQTTLEQADQYQRKVAVSYIDLDGLKQINDNCGHAAGDQVLVECSQRIQQCLRPSDTLARVGGDEFILVLANLRHEHEADTVLQRVIEAANIDFCFDGTGASISASVGTAFFDTHGKRIDELLTQADNAMYLAKKSGKNRRVVAPVQQADNC